MSRLTMIALVVVGLGVTVALSRATNPHPTPPQITVITACHPEREVRTFDPYTGETRCAARAGGRAP